MSQSWSRAALEMAPRRKTGASGLFRVPSRSRKAKPGPKGSGARSRREPRRRRSGAPYGEAALGSGRGRSPCLIRTVSTPRRMALCSLFGGVKEETARDGAANEKQDRARAEFRSENDGAWLGEKWMWNERLRTSARPGLPNRFSA